MALIFFYPHLSYKLLQSYKKSSKDSLKLGGK